MRCRVIKTKQITEALNWLIWYEMSCHCYWFFSLNCRSLRLVDRQDSRQGRSLPWELCGKDLNRAQSVLVEKYFVISGTFCLLMVSLLHSRSSFIMEKGLFKVGPSWHLSHLQVYDTVPYAQSTGDITVMVIIGKTQIHCRELGFYPVLSDKASRTLTLTTPFFKLLLHW